jgi:hypothetical protein
MDFKEVYKFPLKMDELGEKVWTTDDEMAFDFCDSWLPNKNAFIIPDKDQRKLVDLLNSEESIFETKTKLELKYENGTIFVIQNFVKRSFINIRGWDILQE